MCDQFYTHMQGIKIVFPLAFSPHDPAGISLHFGAISISSAEEASTAQILLVRTGILTYQETFNLRRVAMFTAKHV